MHGIPGVFNLDDGLAYGRWRDAKVADQPAAVGDLVVAVSAISAPTSSERAALRDRIGRWSMAVYAESPQRGRDDKAALKALAAGFGLSSIDANQLADDDGVTPLAVHREGARSRYIPYTERPITWHTDGYYNTPGRTVRSLLLHCASPAAHGGANRLMDVEMLYILLREEDPDLIRVLMAPDAMTIPGNDEEGMRRPATVGPVFSVDAGGHLHMRYTARARNVEWSEAARPAAEAIRRHLDAPSPYIFEHILQAGQGLIANNPLHTREPFTDDPARPRLLYRARYHERI
ncbi:taurine catabolism dioxygenase TauD [Paramagnetospirillum kuznetsovii]|uniref:Taurine catabolism dioxygenase TauD n=1 Tax=Paramagnetospirillum kuznetsovii TaxID=2053833 RepID=A0A364P240_9PROT|nr:TauD/TfdA family dioxygenase [Paramagnetospirillum kuznetsovii]RAU23381.1 taurine catabolism dioxygenase TauD [Paramagnetospirillum kuznetsovii]